MKEERGVYEKHEGSEREYIVIMTLYQPEPVTALLESPPDLELSPQWLVKVKAKSASEAREIVQKRPIDIFQIQVYKGVQNVR